VMRLMPGAEVVVDTPAAKASGPAPASR